MIFVSMSWWMSQSVQAYLDALKLEAGDADKAATSGGTISATRTSGPT